MKILHVIAYIDPTFGGPSVVVRDMAEASRAIGNEVHIATTCASMDSDSNNKEGTIFKEGIIFHYFKRSYPFSWFRSSIMNQWLLKNVSNFDLLHLHVPFTAPLLFGAKSALISGRPYVVTLHGVLDPWSLRQKSWKKIPYFHLFDRNILNKACFLHVTSTSEGEHIVKLKVETDIRLIRPCVPVINIERFNVNLNNQLRILCIARLDPVKAHKVLFEAVAQLIEQGFNIVLDIAGDGKSSFKEELKRHVLKLGIDHAVFWHGHVDTAKKLTLYASSWCFALLSFHESFGLAAAEAMSAGLPVVVSDQVGLSEDVKSYGAGLVVETKNVPATVNAFKLLMNGQDAKVCSTKALKLANELYNKTSFSNNLDKLYRDAISA